MECLRDIVVRNFLTDSCHQHNGDGETESSCKTVYSTLQDIIVLLHVCKGHAKNCTVGGDQRQIHAKCLVKRRHAFLQEHFHKLYQRCNDQNEHDGLQISQIQRLQDQLVDHTGYKERRTG